jgi:PAS domain S-box-containing protein
MHPLSQFPLSELWRDQIGLLLESTGDGICGIDMDGKCIYANRAAADMLGHEPAHMLGHNMHDLMHHTHADGSHYSIDTCPIFRAFWQGMPCRIDTEVLWRSDGTSFPAEYSSHPIVDQGVVRGAVVTFIDISVRRREQDLLQRSKNELERRVTDRTRALSDALAQLRELSAHLHSVREDERTRIAREIHDELGSLLIALKFDVNWLDTRLVDRADLSAKCRAMNRLIETAVDNVGRIMTDLRPSLLDHQGLFAALEWQLREFESSSDVVCDWQLDVDPGVVMPDDTLATAIFRIFQEMLSNIARHARADRVAIRIRVTYDQLRIVVTDNGVGALRDAFERPDAYGVMGMRERARHFGGEIGIDSIPGEGTRLTLDIPIPSLARGSQ